MIALLAALSFCFFNRLELVSLAVVCRVSQAAFTPTNHPQPGRNSFAPATTTAHLYSAQPEDDDNGGIAEQALHRTAAHLEKLKSQELQKKNYPGAHKRTASPISLSGDEDQLAREYLLQSANSMKEELKRRKLSVKGRKPDLARRLAQDDLKFSQDSCTHEDIQQVDSFGKDQRFGRDTVFAPLTSFAGLRLSEVAGEALAKAGFIQPTPVQAAALPRIGLGGRSRHGGESCILHAETGSGKTLAYLLPVTEQLWIAHASQKYRQEDKEEYALILTPTRELASQVAGIASVLAPPGTVRLVTRPTNLMSEGQALKEQGELENGGRLDESGGSILSSRCFVGSAKAIMQSLYGDEQGRLPTPPTSKPEAMYLLKNVRWLILDEVDRLLAVKKSRTEKQYKKIHEKPAAIVAAAVARWTLGRAQVVAASATVGRPLKRELARVLGLTPQECPPVIGGGEVNNDARSDDQNMSSYQRRIAQPKAHNVGRAVTIPKTVEHYVLPVDGSSVGKLLTAAHRVVRDLGPSRKILLVLTRGFGMSTQNVIGALNHFQCQPEPQSLLDALECADGGTSIMMEIHRQVTGATGVGESLSSSGDKNIAEEILGPGRGYLLVTGEDTIRGLHLDGLEIVIIVGRPAGPDEYTHIAGRTGRAGRSGRVINIVSFENAAAIKSWERMLDVKVEQLKDVKGVTLLEG